MDIQSRLHFHLIVEAQKGVRMLQWGLTDQKTLLRNSLPIIFWNSVLVLDMNMKISRTNETPTSTRQDYLQGHASHLLTTLFIVANLHEMFKPYPQSLDYNECLVSSF